MARPLRIEYPGALYHVTSRGNAREDIFFDEKDRQRFLATLAHVIRDYHWICYAYCQMTNHYHLLIETPEANLSRGMRQLNGVYTQALNRRHGRVGHIFQGRFKALLVEKDGYLLELCRYIVLNPEEERGTFFRFLVSCRSVQHAPHLPYRCRWCPPPYHRAGDRAAASLP